MTMCPCTFCLSLSGDFWHACTMEKIISKLHLLHTALKGSVKPVSAGSVVESHNRLFFSAKNSSLLPTCLVLRQAQGKVWGGGTICSCWDRIAVWELGLWWRQLYYPPPGLSLHFSPSLHQWVGVRQSPSPLCAPAVGEAPWWGTKDWEGSVLLPSRFFTCFCCLTLVERILPTIVSSHEWSLKDFPRRCRYLLIAKGASSMSVWIKGRKNPQFFNGLSGQPMYNWHLL